MDNTAKESRAKYYREWRKKNPGKCKQYQERYWARRAERETKAAGQEQKEGDANNG